MAAPPAVDVAVVGGGPAGAAAAIALAAHDPGRSVVLVEASTFAAQRPGETLHPAARPLLERLGVWERFAALDRRDAAGTASAWGDAALGGEDFITSAFGRGFHLDRRAFDAMLAQEAAARGASVLLGQRLTGVERSGGAFRLELDGAGGRRSLEASFVVDATGRSARVATALGARRVFFDRQVAALVFFDVGEGSFQDTRTLVEAVEDGWWYSALLPASGAVAVLMTDGDLAARLRLREPAAWRAALAASHHTRERLASATPRGAPAIHAAESSALDVPAGEGWVAAGDAAMAFDPLSGQGIVKALHQGVLAAYAASDALAGRPGVADRFRARIAGELEGYLDARARCYSDEARWPGSTFWRRRRPELRLSPDAVLRARAPGAAARLAMHLPRAELSRLAALCNEGGEGRRAHEVVGAARRSGVTASDRRVIFALQYLLDEDVVQLVERSP